MKAMIKMICGIYLLSLALPLAAQSVGTAADSPAPGHGYAKISYSHLSRNFNLEGTSESVTQKIWLGEVGFRPNRLIKLYGFGGSSDFSNSRALEQRQLYFGGGLKLTMIGEVDVEEESGRRVRINAGVGLDFQMARLQSSGDQAYDSLGLTRYQGALDLGLRVFGFAGYLGFKLSKVSGAFRPASGDDVAADSQGLFSLFLGFNGHLSSWLSVVSEVSFISDKMWSLGLRLDL